MSARPSARRVPCPPVAAARSVGRRRGCRGSGPAPPGDVRGRGGDLRRRRVAGLRPTPTSVTGPILTDRPIDATVEARGQNLFLLQTGPLEAALRDSRRSPAPGRGRAAGHARRDDPGAGAGPHLAGRCQAIPRRRAASCSPCSLTIRRRRRLPVIEDRRASSAGLWVGQRLSPVDLDAATRLASLRAADVGAPRRTSASSSPTRTGHRPARPAGWAARLRLLYAEAPDDRAHPRPGPPPPQPAGTAASRRRAGGPRHRETDGTYIPRSRRRTAEAEARGP